MYFYDQVSICYREKIPFWLSSLPEKLWVPAKAAASVTEDYSTFLLPTLDDCFSLNVTLEEKQLSDLWFSHKICATVF
jgi:hypothetical protein